MPITKATASSIAPAAKGDLVVGSATNDAAVLGVGSNDQVLTADSSTATGLKWAAVAGGSYTSLASGSLNGLSTLDLQSISGSYRKLSFQISDYSMSTNTNIDVRLNNDSGTNYAYGQIYNSTSINRAQDQTSIYVAANNSAETGGQVIFEIENYATACKHAGIAYNFSVDNTNWNFTYWGHNNSAAVDRIQIVLQNGAFDAGTYVLYGVK